jgi:hypothetical protein
LGLRTLIEFSALLKRDAITAALLRAVHFLVTCLHFINRCFVHIIFMSYSGS